MTRAGRTYLVLAGVFVGSGLLTWILRSSGVWAELAATPAVIALIGALYQLVRDEAQHLRTVALQHDRQRFELGATSHMANVAFDKHVGFCEEYCAELHNTLTVLYREGTSVHALTQADRLRAIINKHTVWVTPEIESRLQPFDRALRKMGAAAHLYNADPRAANASGRVAQMHDIFADILGLEKEPGTENQRGDLDHSRTRSCPRRAWCASPDRLAASVA